MTNSETLNIFFDTIIDGLAIDAASKQQKFPLSSLHYETNDQGGTLYGAGHIKYLIHGRRPGKQPPPDVMLRYVQDNPDALARAREVYKNITEQSLAFLIGRKISEQGTDIFSGKKPGIDLDGVMKNAMPELLKMLAINEVMSIKTAIGNAAK